MRTAIDEILLTLPKKTQTKARRVDSKMDKSHLDEVCSLQLTESQPLENMMRAIESVARRFDVILSLPGTPEKFRTIKLTMEQLRAMAHKILEEDYRSPLQVD